MLSKEENTADIIDPPTEEELNMAITGNMKRLLVVVSCPQYQAYGPADKPQMKAARKFKQKLFAKRPELMESIFGGSSRLVQPPGAMKDSSANNIQRSQSADIEDRRPVERALTSEGVHHDIDLSPNRDRPPREMEGEDKSSPTPDQLSRRSTAQEQHRSDASPHSRPRSESGAHKGQAHDPLEDLLFLHIGNGIDESSTSDESTEAPPPEILVVSESPGAVGMNVYEQAYQEEIERILKAREEDRERRRPTIFLTRRVEDVKAIRENVHVTAGEAVANAGEKGAKAKMGLAGIAAKVKENAQPSGKDGESKEEEEEKTAAAET